VTLVAQLPPEDSKVTFVRILMKTTLTKGCVPGTTTKESVRGVSPPVRMQVLLVLVMVLM